MKQIQLYIQTYFPKSSWNWTLENKSEYVVENNLVIYNLIIFQKCVCFCWIEVYAELIFAM